MEGPREAEVGDALSAMGPSDINKVPRLVTREYMYLKTGYLHT